MKNTVLAFARQRRLALLLSLAFIGIITGSFAASAAFKRTKSVVPPSPVIALAASPSRVAAPRLKNVLPERSLAAFDYFKVNEMAMMFAAPTLSYNNQLRVLNIGDSVNVNPTSGPLNADNIFILGTTCYSGGITVNNTNGIVQLFSPSRTSPSTNQTCTITIRATNNQGVMGAQLSTDATFQVQVNYPPTFTVQSGITRTAGSPSANSKILDNLNDDYTGNGSLIVTVNGSSSATVNGVTVSNLSRNGNMYFADIVAGCNATTASFTLAVTEPGVGGLQTSSTLTVMVNPNTPPDLSYQSMATMNNPPLINEGQNINFNPLTGPSDNNQITSLTITGNGGLTTAPTIQNNPNNPNYGRVSITNAGPGGGTATLNVTATDNCNLMTSAQIKVKINARPNVAPTGGLAIRQGGTLTNFQIATVNDPEDGIPPTINFTPLTNGGVTFSNVQLNTTTGAVTANITADCTAPLNSALPFTLTATDSNGLTSNGTNNVMINVAANTPPVLSYASTVSVAAGTPSTIISPTSGPSDTGGLASLSLQSYSGGCGTLLLNSSPLTNNPNLGRITLTGVPNTSQTCTVTVRAVDACGGTNGTTDASFTIKITAPMIGINKTHTQASVIPGEIAQFNLNYSNTGDQDASGVTLTETIPVNTTFDATASAGGWSCANGAPAGTTCTYNVGNIGAGGAGSVLFAVRVVNPIASGVTQIANQFTYSDPVSGSITSNSDTIPIVAFPDVAITKTDNGITSGPGQTIVYNVGWSNVGRRNALGVVVSETVPANTTFNAGASTAGWSCANGSAAGTVCTRTIGALAGGGAGMAAFAVTVVNPLPNGVTTITNTATISESSASDPDDPVTSNNTTIDTTPVGTGPQITPQVVGLTAGTPAANIKIATVTDDLSPASTITVVTTSLPAGITFNNITNQNGMIFADVAAACGVAGGSYIVGLKATDAGGRMVTANSVNNVVVAANTAPVLGNYPTTGPINQSAGATVTPSAAPSDNGTISTLVATSGTFTGNLSVSPAGIVNVSNAGPAGVHTITVTATDNCGLAASRTFQLTVNGPPTITPAATLTLQQGTAAVNAPVATVSDDLTAAGSLTVVKTFAPVGINVTGVTNTGGAVTANIAADCTANLGLNTVTFQVTDAGGLSSSANFSVNVTANTAPTLGSYAATTLNAGTNTTVTPSAAPADNGTVASLTAVSSPGFTGTLSTNIATGAVTINNAGPVGNFTITVTATDNCGAQTSTTFALNITCPTITVNVPTLATGTVGTALGPNASFTFTQTGGQGNINYQINSGQLPQGITLSAAGLLSGTPSQSGSFPITVKATDANNCMGVSATYTLVINCQTITVTAPVVTTGTVGASFSQTFTQTGGLGSPINFTLMSGSLPNGLTLALNGTLAGTPTQNGSFPVVVKVTDGNGCMGTVNYTLVINCPTITVAPATLPNGKYGEGYNQTISATPAGTYNYTVTTGALPPGLSLNPMTGVLNGVPSQVGTFNFTITANYYGSCLQPKPYTLVIDCPTITFTPENLATATIGSPYTQTVTAAPSTPFTYGVIGSLPPGVTLDPATGVISGTPTAIGTYTFTITATGGGSSAVPGCMGSKAYTIIVNCRVVTVTPPTGLPGGTVGGAYNQTVSATPAGTYTFSVSNGSLPPGLSLNSTTGVISGTPTTASTYNFTIKATDPDTCAGTQAYQVVITCPTVTLSPTALPTGTIGVVYLNTNFTAAPAGNYSFTVTSGQLPAGLTLTSGGLLSGTPTQAGNFPIVVTATDANNCTGSRSYTVVINNCPPITVDPVTIATGTSGSSYSQSFSATGGAAPYTFAKNGTLPNGLTLSSDGVLSGTPTLTGDFPITVIATDKNGCTGSRAYTLKISVGCTFGIAPAGQGFSFYGGNGTVAVTANSGCQWTAFTNDPWITVTSGASGSGNGTVGYSVAINNTGAPRTGTLTVASQTFNITQAANTGGLQYYPLATPVRLLDTRLNQSACITPNAPLASGSTTTLTATGGCTGIPANARAVVGNGTVVSSQGQAGYITLYPAGAPLPNASNLNFVPGQVVPNAFTVGLNGAGAFNVSAAGSTDFIVDVTGYYAPPSPTGLYFHPLSTPVRLLDTRPDPFTSCVASSTPLASASTTTLLATGSCTGIPATAKAIVGNATVVNFQSAGGHITLFPSGAPPNASNLNYTGGQVVPNAFTVGLDGSGQFKVFAAGATNFIVDVTGYYSTEAVDANGEGLLFYPLSSPGRWLDTRPDPTFSSCVAASTPLGAGSTTALTAQLTCGALTIPNTARAVFGNATVVSSQGQGGYITLFPAGTPLPNASNLNYTAGEVVPNAFIVGLGTGGAFNIFAAGATDFIVDLSAYFSL